MMFAAIWEANLEELDEILARYDELREDHKKNPGKYPQRLRLQDGKGVGFTFIGQGRGVAIIEATYEQLHTIAQAYRPLIKIKFLPVAWSRHMLNFTDPIE